MLACSICVESSPVVPGGPTIDVQLEDIIAGRGAPGRRTSSRRVASLVLPGGQVRALRLNTRPDWSAYALFKPEIAQNGPGTAEDELSQVGSILSPQAPAAAGGVDLSSNVGACGGQVCKIGAQDRASHASHVRSRPGLALCRSFERYTAHAPRGRFRAWQAAGGANGVDTASGRALRDRPVSLSRSHPRADDGSGMLSTLGIVMIHRTQPESDHAPRLRSR